ncbi:hypothetical protein ACFW2T_01285 [Streptomyces sp. NPDC058892]|uniref:hypothetical protein n=1 Tax=unclassified Streptomyces TaxID=2593676 RepID=UPI00369CB1DF
MQLRRALPLSLAALLASAGCVCVGPHDPAAAPSRAGGSVPSADGPERAAPPALPLGELPPAVGTGPAPGTARAPAAGPDRTPAPASPGERPRVQRAAPPRHNRLPGAPTAHLHRRPAPPPRLDELCAAADGVVPPSVVDLCLRQYGR